MVLTLNFCFKIDSSLFRFLRRHGERRCFLAFLKRLCDRLKYEVVFVQRCIGTNFHKHILREADMLAFCMGEN